MKYKIKGDINFESVDRPAVVIYATKVYNLTLDEAIELTLKGTTKTLEIMKLYEVNGTYGSGKTPCTVFVAQLDFYEKWYVAKGSVNVKSTDNPIRHGVNIETLEDIDMFTASSPINSLEDLEQALEA
jgi:hypothetical protein